MKKASWVVLFFDVLIILLSGIILLKNNNLLVNKSKREQVALNETTINTNKIDESLFVYNEYKKRSDSVFEEEVINRNLDNDIYKTVKLKIDGFDAHMFIVYKPEHIRLMVGKKFNTNSTYGLEKILDMTSRYNALAGINGGGFIDRGEYTLDTPIGYVIKDNEVIWGKNSKRKGNLIGFDNNHKLVMLTATGDEAVSTGVRDAVEFGPYLVINGEITEAAKRISNVTVSRTMLAQREDGIVLMLVTDGGTLFGARTSKIIDALLNYGAYNIANLDGGASSQLVDGDKLLNKAAGIYGTYLTTGRIVVDGFGIFKDINQGDNYE